METMLRVSARAASTKSSHAPGTRALVPLVAFRFSCVRTIAWGLQRLMICLMLCNGQWLVFGLALGQRLTILEPSSHPATVLKMQASRLIPRVVIVEHLRKCAATESSCGKCSAGQHITRTDVAIAAQRLSEVRPSFGTRAIGTDDGGSCCTTTS